MPLPSTMTPIATQTLGSATASVTFSSIAGTYTDLVLIINSNIPSGASGDGYLTFNGDNGTNYSYTQMYGNGTTAASNRGTSQTNIRAFTAASTAQSTAIINILNYANTSTYKTIVGRNNDPSAVAVAVVGLWRNTAAITSLTLSNQGSANFGTGSTFTLYGIKAA